MSAPGMTLAKALLQAGLAYAKVPAELRPLVADALESIVRGSDSEVVADKARRAMVAIALKRDLTEAAQSAYDRKHPRG